MKRWVLFVTIASARCAARTVDGESNRGLRSIPPERAESDVVIEVRPRETSAWTHYETLMVGSGHMALSLREDYRNHLRMLRRDLGAKYVRGHGLFNNDMHVAYAPGLYSFVNVDSFTDFLLSIDMRPCFELSFMPDWMSSNQSIPEGAPSQKGYGYHSNFFPPSNMSLWHDLVHAMVRHQVERYGIETVSDFRYEVWNEPNAFFWQGTQTQYFELYRASAAAIKSVDKRLQVGGPATCTPTGWLEDFLAMCRNTSTPFDFISSHNYAGCGEAGSIGNVSTVVRGVKDAREIVGDDVQFLVTEYGSTCTQGIGLAPNGATSGDMLGSHYHDVIDQAAFTLAVADQVGRLSSRPPDSLSYWAFSDVFEEFFWPVHNTSFHGAFGLVNLASVPKPTYRAYQLLRDTGDVRLGTTVRPAPSSASDTTSCAETVGAIAVRNSTTGTTDILVYNHVTSTCNWQVQESPCNSDPITNCSVTIATEGWADASQLAKSTIRRIDSTHANPLGKWVELGAPDYTTLSQDTLIMAASEMHAIPLGTDKGVVVGTNSVDVHVPSHGIAAIRIPASKS